MPKRKQEEQFAALREKDCWHPLSLQDLNPSKFQTVVSKILSGNYVMVNSKFEKKASLKFY